MYVCGTFLDQSSALGADTDVFWAEFDEDLTLTRMFSYGVEDANESSFGGCAIDVDGTHLMMTFASNHQMTVAGLDMVDTEPEHVFDGTQDGNDTPFSSFCQNHLNIDTAWTNEYREIEKTCTN